MAAIAPWDSIGFQILFAWMAFIIVACWLGGRLEKARSARERPEARRAWRAEQDRRRRQDSRRRSAA